LDKKKNYFLQKAGEKYKKMDILTSPNKRLHQKEKLSQYQKKIAIQRIVDCVI